MANAAAKKAAAGKAAATSTYKPLLLISNAIFLSLQLIRQWDYSFSLWGILGIVTLLGLQYFAYVGILDDAANSAASSDKSKALVGGASLDLLGMVWVVQFGSVLITRKFYWLLGLLPPLGAWKLYSTFRSSPLGGGDQNAQPASVQPEDEIDDKVEKRKKRAERRRNKWS